MIPHEKSKFRVVLRIVLRGSAIMPLFLVLFLFMPQIVDAATLFAQPSSGELAVGDTFFLEIRLDTEGEEVNAAEVSVAYPEEVFEVIDADNGGSFLTLWPRPPVISITNSLVEFSAGTPEGFNGKDGLVGRIFFRVRGVSENAQILFKGIRVLLSDGEGTPTDVSLLEPFFTVLPARSQGTIPGFISLSHPDQLLWSNANTFVLHWDAKPGARYSYLLSRDVFMKPDDIPDTPVGDIKYENLEDGIYYFHLRELNETNAREKWRAMIDAAPPDIFEARLVDEAELGVGAFLSFSTQDSLSGLEEYQLCYGENVPGREGSVETCRVVSSPTGLTKEDLARELLIVRAYDKAGNFSASVVKISHPFSWVNVWFIGIFVGGALLWGLFRMSRFRSFIRVLVKGV